MLATMAGFVYAQQAKQTQNNQVDMAPKSEFSSSPIQLNPNNLPIPSLAGSRANILYDNGPLVNGPGQGAGGADASVVQTSLGMGIYGWNFGISYPYSIADDFVVPGGETWNIESLDFFGYEHNASTTSPFTACYVQIWNGNPSVAGSSVIWGDLVTNRLSSTSYTYIYRVLDTDLGSTLRPVMRLVCSTPSLSLPSGIYWIEYAATGSVSAVYTPPVTINGSTGTGNALQYDGSIWSSKIDVGPQDFPFLICGTGSSMLSETFTSSGDGTWTAPAGISTVVVELWGGGGCGDAGGWWYTNGGGGGGAYSKSTLSVTPGQTYNYHVGAGSAPASDQPGEDSWFRAPTTAMAKGGGPGLTGPYAGSGTGGTGGAAASSIGDVKFTGGNGNDGVWSAFSGYGGGGGSSAGAAANGNSAVNRIGATAPTGGGNGGNGSNWSWIGNGNGSPGIAPGGGGGGGRNGNGGRGANGRLVISYAGAPAAITDLSIIKTVTDPAAPPYYFGTLITFTIVLTNNGPDNATAVEVTDLLASGFTYDSHTASAGTSYNQGTGVWTIGTLNNGATKTLTLTATIEETGDYQNTAAITAQGADEVDPDMGDRESTINIEPIELDNVPVSNWALYLGIGLIVAFTVIRMRRIL